MSDTAQMLVRAEAERARALLVPGNDLDAVFYTPLCRLLADGGVTVTALTLPAFLGRGSPAAASWEGLVAAVAEAAAEALPEGGLLIGHSLGGLVALLAAARASGSAGVTRLALLEPAIAPTRALARRAARSYREHVAYGPRDRFENWPGAFRRVARPEAYPPWAIERYLAFRRVGDPAVVAALLEGLPELYPLPRPDLPTLVVCGASSGWRARLGAWVVARRLGAARATIAGAGHWLANEADAALAELLIRFACEGAGDSPDAVSSGP